MSTIECPPHHDLVANTEVDPQLRATHENHLAVQHNICPGDDSTVTADDSAASLRKINDTQAKTKNLPSEILSVIFEFVCPPVDFSDRFGVWHPWFCTFRAENNFHLILAAVCHDWREVVLSTPQLWTTITVRPNRPGRSIQNVTSLLNLYFERAGALPISIELDFKGETTEWHARRSSPIKVDKEYLARLEPLKNGCVYRWSIHDTTPQSHPSSYPMAPTR